MRDKLQTSWNAEAHFAAVNLATCGQVSLAYRFHWVIQIN